MTDAHDAIWAALGNPLRRRILDVLADGPAATGVVTAALETDRHVVIAHLKVLREVDLVRVEPRGRERFNHLNPVPLQDAVGRWISRYEQDWAAALVGLRDTVEASSDTGQLPDGVDRPVSEQQPARRRRGA